MSQTLEICIKVELTPKSLSSVTKLMVDGQQIGSVSHLRVDVDVGETLPRIEVDLLKGIDLDLLTPEVRAAAEAQFELLRKCPGVVARMPAPRDG